MATIEINGLKIIKVTKIKRKIKADEKIVNIGIIAKLTMALALEDIPEIISLLFLLI